VVNKIVVVMIMLVLSAMLTGSLCLCLYVLQATGYDELQPCLSVCGCGFDKPFHKPQLPTAELVSFQYILKCSRTYTPKNHLTILLLIGIQKIKVYLLFTYSLLSAHI
jgi:hypothetical protein